MTRAPEIHWVRSGREAHPWPCRRNRRTSSTRWTTSHAPLTPAATEKTGTGAHVPIHAIASPTTIDTDRLVAMALTTRVAAGAEREVSAGAAPRPTTKTIVAPTAAATSESARAATTIRRRPVSATTERATRVPVPAAGSVE